MDPEDRAAYFRQGLAEAQETISPRYDDVFREVQQRIDGAGSAGKTDIAMLTCWKRLRTDTPWVAELLGLPDSEVREVTTLAVLVARSGDVVEAAGEAREMLRSLPGFARGTAVASAVLTAASPTRLAIYDKRARRGLQNSGLSWPTRAQPSAASSAPAGQRHGSALVPG
jgi:hypothetical protein